MLAATEDHLRTVLIVLKTGPLPGFALYSLLRVAAEAAVRCRHLVDLNISEVDRLGRALNERRDNLIEQRHACTEQAATRYREAAEKIDRRDRTSLRRLKRELEAHQDQCRAFCAGRIEHLRKRAARHGVKPQMSSPKIGQPELIGFSEAMPSVLDLFARYMRKGSTTYRYLSGHVHSKPWVQLAARRAHSTTDPTVSVVATDVNINELAAVLTSVLDVYDGNVENWLSLAGYPSDIWGEAKKGG